MAWTAFVISFRLFYRRLPIFLAGNVLWILASLPLVTLPAATGGLFYLIHRVILEERELDPVSAQISDFWVGFRQCWRRSTALVLLDGGVIALMAFALRFYWQSPSEPMRWFVGPVAVLLLAWLLLQLNFLPQMIVFPERSIREIVRQSLFLVLAYPMFALLLFTWQIILIVVCIALAGPVFLVLFSLLALIQSMALRFVRIESGELKPVVRPPQDA